MTSPTPAERAALKVAEAAAMSPASAYGLPSTIVFALGSAGLLMDPDTAAELDEYRRQFPSLLARKTELEELIERRTSLLRDVQQIAQRRSKEAAGRRKHGDALKAEIDRLAGLLREAVAGAVVADELYTAWLQRAEAAELRTAELEARVLAVGAAAEQRHQIEDPSEPPLGCFMTGEICALALADALAPHPEPCRFPSGPDCTCVPQAVTA